MTAPHWHTREAAEVVAELGSDARAGLAPDEAAARLARSGPNELQETGARGPLAILWEQFKSAMVVMLIVAAIVSLALGEHVDAVAILVIVVLNAALGFFQDYRAERAMAALKQLAVPTVRVRRGGHVMEISARELVPGDVVQLETGGFVPADGRLIDGQNLKVQEAALTGESEAVEKHTRPLQRVDAALGDRRNMVYMGTVVVYGHGLAVVTAAGMQTELGSIAGMLQSVVREPTPLQRRLARFGRVLAVAALVLVAIVFVVGMVFIEPDRSLGERVRLMFMTSLSLAVAAVPEGLPAVATVALALGARKMLKRRALIRKLPAVETLGSVTVICSDKTGTLTENRMTVAVVDFAGDQVDFTEDLHAGSQRLPPDDPRVAALDRLAALVLQIVGGAMCNDAELEFEEDPQQFHTVGDPTEGALVAVAAQLGLDKPALDRLLPRVGEVPFDSDRKRMSTIHRLQAARDDLPPPLRRALNLADAEGNAACIVFTKGAVDRLLELSRRVWVDQGAVELNADWRGNIDAAHDNLAGGGMRVLGVAFRLLDEVPSEHDADDAERELTFLGLTAMIDPPRPEAKQAVERCRTAGIRPVMITGDHPLTAENIAAELGIETQRVLTGQELSRMGSDQLAAAVEEVSVYARVSPQHKLDIVDALKRHGEIVAMTGDGVNDAPALKKADIGVAMGITGTDVSKEAADMVLLDDNFATNVAAVEEGRVIYDNIRKFLQYTMTSNLGEIWVMLLGPILGMPLPLLPLQILWINLVTDGLPGLALAVEPGERNTMRRPPYPPGESFLSRGIAWQILGVGLLMGLVSLAAGWWHFPGDVNTADDSEALRYWRTMTFMVLTLSQMGNVLAVRSNRDSLFRIGLFSNPWLLGAVALTFALQLTVTYLPPMQQVFETTALSLGDLGIALLLSTIVFWAVETQKFVARRFTNPGGAEL